MGSFVNSSPQLLLNSHLHYYDRTHSRSLYKYASQKQNSTTTIQSLEQQRKRNFIPESPKNHVTEQQQWETA